ncbi:hypothetical protein [Dyadobacter sp. CY351]|uniref:hypothetical protein n=1 Tax=Dyadobacter sp. CY351 TaxID=2909337 RepID=UPI001F398694|nr:hypothetical protein [Dyadobacter sp. CY351]MCF2518533.1 hypothetical protein [Dyadobacter sp. CY351]
MPRSNIKLKNYVDEDFLRRLRSNNYLIIGLCGHRDLPQDDLVHITELLKERIDSLRANRKIAFITGLAPGADQLIVNYMDADLDDCLIVIEALNDKQTKTVSCEDSATDFERYLDPGFEHKRIRLYEHENYELSVAGCNKQFELLGKVIVEHADILLLLWDGIPGGLIGGTADVSRIWHRVYTSDKTFRKKSELHHLLTPRLKNKHPIGLRTGSGIFSLSTPDKFEWITHQSIFNQRKSLSEKLFSFARSNSSWLWISLIVVLPIFFFDPKSGFSAGDVAQTSILLMFYVAAWSAYNRFPNYRTILLSFVYPLMLAISVLVIGTWGFLLSIKEVPLLDAVIMAARLMTLDSVFHSNVSPNPQLEVGRVLGLFVTGYSFVLALSLALGREGLSRISFWRYRIMPGQQRYTVVIGDGMMALNLVVDLIKKGKRVLYLDEGNELKLTEILSFHRVWHLKGNLTSKLTLRKTHFQNASKVFVIGKSDEENFRIIQELDELDQNRGTSSPDWHVHLSQKSTRELLHELSQRKKNLHTFSINENISRKHLNKFPLDRFNKKSNGEIEVAKVIILGFSVIAQELVLNLIRLGHYTKNKILSITIYLSKDENEAAKNFKLAHPELFNPSALNSLAGFESIQEYVFYEGRPSTVPLLEFKDLPCSQSLLHSPEFDIYHHLRPDQACTIYSCLSASLQAIETLAALLPRISWIKFENNGSLDVQCFCHYNLPDKNEEEFVEARLRSLAPSIPIFCFGNLLDHCSETAIVNEELLIFAKRISLSYVTLFRREALMGIINQFTCTDPAFPEFARLLKVSPDTSAISYKKHNIKVLNSLITLNEQTIKYCAEQIWKDLKEEEKESNIHAADHAQVKFRLIKKDYHAIANFGEYWSEAEISTLGEVEHRRWCAEKLTYGWLPYQNEPVWNKYKKDIKAQKYHLHLTTYTDLLKIEQEKDDSQVYILPFLFKLSISTKSIV